MLVEIDLLDYLAYQMGCGILSDLRLPYLTVAENSPLYRQFRSCLVLFHSAEKMIFFDLKTAKTRRNNRGRILAGVPRWDRN